jgi:4-amino-4-deoxy-L-arabinose transferase-like glycosyltransferase
MPRGALGGRGVACLVILTLLAIGLGLGTSHRLTYHEAFVAQGAREIVAAGQWWHPTIGGLPWLEKPPLPFWLVAALGWCFGAVTPAIARIPSTASAVGLVLAVALLATRRYGRAVGLLAGAVQATTGWTVLRGRLAEADLLLACLIAWSLLAFDRMRLGPADQGLAPMADTPPGWRPWRWVFFGLLGALSLVKGTGFGAALVLSAVGLVLFWDRDRATWQRLRFPAGWIAVAIVALSWPLAMIGAYGPRVLGLWFLHVSERVGSPSGHGPFAGESWREYALNVLGQALPWTPLAVMGAWRSLGRALRGPLPARGGIDPAVPDVAVGDRLLWAWGTAPLALVSIASARNAHYAIHAMIPWSIWSALGLVRLGGRLHARGWRPGRIRRLAHAGFVGLAAAYGLGFWLLGPWFDRRGVEWAFYEDVGREVAAGEPLVLLYDDWDRDPYPTPFGPIPHDLAVRLFYLERPACWHFEASAVAAHASGSCAQGVAQRPRPSVAILGRERDLPALQELGRVECVTRGPSARWDRSYLLARVWPARQVALADDAPAPLPPPAGEPDRPGGRVPDRGDTSSRFAPDDPAP